MVQARLAGKMTSPEDKPGALGAKNLVGFELGSSARQVFKIEQTAQHAHEYPVRAHVGSCRVPASRGVTYALFSCVET
jgi:hypothetical protein